MKMLLLLLSFLPACTQNQRAIAPPSAALAALPEDPLSPFDDDDDDEDGDTALAKASGPLREPDLAQLLAATGFPKAAIPRLVCTAKFESAFDPQALNHNRNGTQDTGLFQINDIWLQPCGVTRDGLLDPAVNARCALQVFKSQGLAAWSAFKRQRSTCLRYRVATT